MARIDQGFGVGALPVMSTSVACPCGRAFFCVEEHHDTTTRRSAYRFECHCGTARKVSVASGVDPWHVLAMSLAAGGAYARGGLVGGTRPSPAPEPQTPGPELQRIDGSLIGYRAWKISDWRLVGTGGIGLDPWVPGVNEARCAVDEHSAPHERCGCGLYGLARFDDSTSWWSRADVLGAIEAWADVDEANRDRFFLHPNGFRAQYAKIVLLAVSDEYPAAKNAAIRALATEHGADVCKREHLETAAGEHGRLVPDELLAWAREGIDVDLGSNFQANMRALSQAVRASSMTMAEAVKAMSVPFALPFPGSYPNAAKGSHQRWHVNRGIVQPDCPYCAARPPRAKGVRQTLRTPGPPGHGKFRGGDRVRDSRGQVWQCVKAGAPGSWGPEAPLA